ncbi:AEC family transporter [Polynucleobacter sp. MWH-Loch1C5]|jgi:malate permease and related proteins|uniref:AEC family transporter n=1 Tax=Polynucleobacter sp. MWH-Loch1C5 TaxID=2689108 RepID=UPI001C0E5FF7|nr:AEC family transporter [Polynucleobacter sp. MWH-Loch1C5]MBU3541998.1 AEC family transporter [Polynucleobacter sp. MWH-Loch1C5]
MFWRIAGIITPVVLIILVGYLYGRKAHPDMAGINKATLDVIAPLLVVSAFVSKDFVLIDQWSLLLCGVAIVVGSGILAWPIAKISGMDPKTFVPPMMFNNCGNMGLPLAVFAFGSAGLAPAVALFAVSNLMHFTLGVKLVNPRAHISGVFANPMVIATIIGIVLSSTKHLFTLPEPLYISIKLLGDATVPLMLFSLGVRMKDANLSHWREGFLGAIVCPITGLIIALLIAPWIEMSDLQRGLLFVFASLPPAVLNFLVADRNHQEPERVASIVLLGNISAMIFVPIGLYLGLR